MKRHLRYHFYPNRYKSGIVVFPPSTVEAPRVCGWLGIFCWAFRSMILDTNVSLLKKQTTMCLQKNYKKYSRFYHCQESEGEIIDDETSSWRLWIEMHWLLHWLVSLYENFITIFASIIYHGFVDFHSKILLVASCIFLDSTSHSRKRWSRPFIQESDDRVHLNGS